MTAVVSVEKCFVAVVEPLDEINELMQSSIYAQKLGVVTVLYGDSEEFFDNLREAQETGRAILKSLFGGVAATFRF